MGTFFTFAGKSNFMDAVSFVMGEKTQTLRVKSLSDLIHGASINKPISRNAHVSAIFQLEDGTERKFTRIVQGTSSEHRINGEVHFIMMYCGEMFLLFWFVEFTGSFSSSLHV